MGWSICYAEDSRRFPRKKRNEKCLYSAVSNIRTDAVQNFKRRNVKCVCSIFQPTYDLNLRKKEHKRL